MKSLPKQSSLAKPVTSLARLFHSTMRLALSMTKSGALSLSTSVETLSATHSASPRRWPNSVTSRKMPTVPSGSLSPLPHQGPRVSKTSQVSPPGLLSLMPSSLTPLLPCSTSLKALRTTSRSCWWTQCSTKTFPRASFRERPTTWAALEFQSTIPPPPSRRKMGALTDSKTKGGITVPLLLPPAAKRIEAPLSLVALDNKSTITAAPNGWPPGPRNVEMRSMPLRAPTPMPRTVCGNSVVSTVTELTLPRPCEASRKHAATWPRASPATNFVVKMLPIALSRLSRWRPRSDEAATLSSVRRPSESTLRRGTSTESSKLRRRSPLREASTPDARSAPPVLLSMRS
mmetsp:Transcript_48521/g.103952  ORF Transcript_48521/g.103952 Transcript_48521/m.103952 type:complete len:345 (-) Transcript_48521:31-1065(-)